jgi:Flp pilus assembly CpaE family ATPase
LADHIVVIVTPQYPVVTHTLQLLDTLTQWGVPSAKITWALMRQGRGGFSTRDLQRIQLAQWPCLGEWPDDPTTWEGALQRHRPLAETHPDLWQRALTTLVGPLPAPTPPTREHRRWARRTKT